MAIIAYTETRIDTNITRLGKAESIGKKLLSELSRDLLAHVYDTDNPSKINKTLSLVNPSNKKYAVLFFRHFVGWGFNEETNEFTKKSKAFGKKKSATIDFLANESNDLWVWIEDNTKGPTVRPKNYSDKIKRLLVNALSDKKDGISKEELISAILSSETITLDDLIQGS